MKYGSALERKEILTHYNGDIKLSAISQSEKEIPCDFIYMKCLE